MKRLNVKLLAIVAIVFVILTGSVVVVHGIQMNRNIDSLLKRAVNAKKDDLKTALQLYQRYQAIRPNDAQRNAEFATLLADKAQITFHPRDYGAAHRMMVQALTGLEQQIRAKPGENPELEKTMLDLQHRLIDLNMAFQAFGPARDDLKKLKDNGKLDPKSALQLAVCYINTVQYPEARALLESLIGYDSEKKIFDVAKATAPHELGAYGSLAKLLREKMRDEDDANRTVMADRVIDQLIQANPDSARAYLFQAEYLAQYQSRDSARPAVEKALELAPDDEEVLLHGAELYADAKEFDKAAPLVQKGIAKYPKDWRFYKAAVMLADAKNDPAEAKRMLSVGLEALPRDVQLLYLAFDRQVRDRDFDAARETLKKLGYYGIRPEWRDYCQARLLVAEGKMREASQILEPLQAATTKIPQLSSLVDALMVQCYTALNQYDRVLNAANRIQTSAQGQIGKAIAEMSLGQRKKALERFRSIVKQLEEGKEVADMSHFYGPIFQLQVSEELDKPKDERNWRETEDLLAKLREKKSIKEPAISLMEITLLSAKDQKPEAQQRLDELRKQFPNDANVLIRAVTFALQDPNSAQAAERAVQIIDSAPAEVRNHPIMISGRIEAALLRGGKKEELQSRLNQIAALAEKQPTTERAQVYSTLATAYLRIGDSESAAQKLNKAAELLPNDPGVRMMLFNLARLTGDLPKMKEAAGWFEKQEVQDPAQVKLLQASVLVADVRQSQRAKLAANAQAGIVLDEADRRKLSEAKGLLHDIESMRPNWAEQPKLMADIALLEGRNDDAISLLKSVLDMGQANAEIAKQLGNLLHFRHRDAEAEQLLEKYANLLVGDPDVVRLRAAVYMINGKIQAALDTMKDQFPKDSTDPVVHLLHGELLAGADQPDEAEAEFRKSLELEPESSDAWLQLVQLLVKQKKNAEALRAVQSAQIKLPEDRRALTLAQCYEMLGDPAQAEQFYQSALNAGTQNMLAKQQIAAFYYRTNRSEQAKKYLNEILTASPETPQEKECYAWARRMTAELLAADGNYSRFLQAMELLTPQSGQSSADDLYTRIALLFNRSDPNSSRQALRLLEDLQKMRPLNWKERLHLAQLYERVGNWPAASEMMVGLLSDPNNPKPDSSVYITYIEMQLRRGTAGAAAEASNWMQALQSSGVKVTPYIAFLAARVASMQGHGPQAGAILMQILPKQRPLPHDAWPTLTLLVGHDDYPGYLEQLGQYDQAEKLLREPLGNESQKSLLQAGFLARRGKIDQALDLIEQIRPAIGLSSSLHLGLVALSQTLVPPKPEQIARVEKWFDRALREDPDSLNVQMELATLRSVERRWDEVEKIYRAVLKRNDVPEAQRAVVLNNISFVIAMQGKDKDEAMRFITEAVNIYGPQSDMLDTRGIVYLSRGDVERALADLNDAVIVTDPSPIKYVHLAMAQTRAGKLPEARKSLEKAKELKFNPDDLSPLEKTQFQAMVSQLGVTI